MNEKLKELAKISGLLTHKVPNGLAHLHTEKDLEKFAELILKEVFNACDEVCDSLHNPEWRICEEFGMDHDWRLIDERKD